MLDHHTGPSEHEDDPYKIFNVAFKRDQESKLNTAFTDRKDSNPKDSSASNRIDLTLFPDSAVAYGALGMTEGDQKYGGYNYRAVGVRVSVYIAACRRHLAAYFNGEECDPKTQIPHLASALACLAILVDSTVAGNLRDDRPPKSPVGVLQRTLETQVKQVKEVLPRLADRYTEKGVYDYVADCNTWPAYEGGNK